MKRPAEFQCNTLLKRPEVEISLQKDSTAERHTVKKKQRNEQTNQSKQNNNKRYKQRNEQTEQEE